VFCRKYLRDVDRTQLSQLAFVYCLDALDEKLQKQSVTAEAGSDEEDKLQTLMLTYQVRQYAVKMQPSQSPRADQLLMSAYRLYVDVIEVCTYASRRGLGTVDRCDLLVTPKWCMVLTVLNISFDFIEFYF